MPKVFISYASADREFVEHEVIAPLKNYGVDFWHSTGNIRSAEAWENSIREGLKSCDWLLVVLSPRALISKWVNREVHWAMKRERPIIPVMMETCEPDDLHLGLTSLQVIDFRSDTRKAQKELLATWGIDTEIESLYHEAQTAMQQEHWSTAIINLETLLKFNPRHAEAKTLLILARHNYERDIVHERTLITPRPMRTPQSPIAKVEQPQPMTASSSAKLLPASLLEAKTLSLRDKASMTLGGLVAKGIAQTISWLKKRAKPPAAAHSAATQRVEATTPLTSPQPLLTLPAIVMGLILVAVLAVLSVYYSIREAGNRNEPSDNGAKPMQVATPMTENTASNITSTNSGVSIGNSGPKKSVSSMSGREKRSQETTASSTLNVNNKDSERSNKTGSKVTPDTKNSTPNVNKGGQKRTTSNVNANSTRPANTSKN